MFRKHPLKWAWEERGKKSRSVVDGSIHFFSNRFVVLSIGASCFFTLQVVMFGRTDKI